MAYQGWLISHRNQNIDILITGNINYCNLVITTIVFILLQAVLQAPATGSDIPDIFSQVKFSLLLAADEIIFSLNGKILVKKTQSCGPLATHDSKKS